MPPCIDPDNDRSGPLVSVVIPTRNRARLLERALQSVLAQTYRKLDVLVVDDASEDDTPEVVRQVGDARVRYLRHAVRKGGGAARNTGIDAAQGVYVAFLDDDDQWKPRKIERQLEHIAGRAAAICGFTLYRDGVETPGSRRGGGDAAVTGRMLRRTVIGWGTSTFMVRSEVARRVRFDEELGSGQDWDFLIRLFADSGIAYVDEPLVTFDVGGHARITSASFDLPPTHAENRLRIFYKHADFFGPFWLNYHVASRLLYRVRERRDASRHLLAAIRRCGVIPVLVGFVNRFYQKTFGY
ncbi:MAG: glycosyltransferase family 2 protein [Sulfurifustaceae bacterium]